MSNIVHGPGFLMLDNLLAPEELCAVQLYMQFENYTPVHANGWSKAWRVNDGQPLSSGSYLCGRGGKKIAPSQQNAINIVAERILSLESEIDSFLEKFLEWDFISLTTFLYPNGAGLGWHEDDCQYKGAFIFYAHPEWKPSWGGELCIAGEVSENSGLPEKIYQYDADIFEMSGVGSGSIGPEFGWTRRERSISDNGIGTWIYPKPNRLVIIKPGYSHCIKKVEADAGENMRCSVTGFFQKSN
ncbi:2OG-Fe(II) oxygenase [Paludibacterium purpuratum]|uniref:2-oxoglutarate-Fe(II)-dependent oxygenase superfamily protein n=1 Tax=Paludibacterium purpuratum TaxID=1144873 RepID=A0A4R7B7I5_9NEIS|nr:2OG-Fe(II) oxygenase [Paludibacterium purpuratum]TDR79725.1 2-oxoglutarate-Fe(II)-dependent oxygenase superfamily protein [Paludibacterium purpuratum]